jgi:hypothetical protein
MYKTTLQDFIEAGERELAELEEPARTIRAAALHNEMLRRFQPQGDEEFDGNLLDDPISDKDVEEKIIEDHFDLAEDKPASHMAEDGCYEGDEGPGDPRLPKFKPNPLIAHAKVEEIRSWDGRLKKEENIPTRLNNGIIKHAPELERGMVADPLIHDPVERVGMGEIYFEERGYNDYKPTRPYHDRVARLMGRISEKAYERQLKARSGWGDEEPKCERCGDPIIGKRKDTKYCSANCIKRAHDENKIVTR